jgi:hypothetical protein
MTTLPLVLAPGPDCRSGRQYSTPDLNPCRSDTDGICPHHSIGIPGVAAGEPANPHSTSTPHGPSIFGTDGQEGSTRDPMQRHNGVNGSAGPRDPRGAVTDGAPGSPWEPVSLRALLPRQKLVEGLQALLAFPGYDAVEAVRGWAIVEGAGAVEVVDARGRLVQWFAANTPAPAARAVLRSAIASAVAELARERRHAAEDAAWEALEIASVVEEARGFGDGGGGAGFRGELGFVGQGR